MNPEQYYNKEDDYTQDELDLIAWGGGMWSGIPKRD